MAGPHQIWAVDLKTRRPSVFAGSGREARLDGARGEAGFAQPSGLAGDGRTLYVADSESNIIRAIGTGAGGEVLTLAGGDLFEFGDRDGRGDEVRLQHPLGLALDEGRLLIADTYNHKIKVLDPRTRRVLTFAGTGKSGQSDGARAEFYEPGGISVARGKLYVADTNNHAVRVVDLATKQTSTLAIRGLTPPAGTMRETDEASQVSEASGGPNAEELKVATQRLGVSGGAPAELVVEVDLPEGHHLNPSAPHRYQIEVVGAEGVPAHLVVSPALSKSKLKTLPLRVNLTPTSPGASVLRVQLTLYYCREDNTGVCRIKTLVWRVPVEVTAEAGAPREIKLRGKVE